jgi:hypothetical protein
MLFTLRRAFEEASKQAKRLGAWEKGKTVRARVRAALWVAVSLEPACSTIRLSNSRRISGAAVRCATYVGDS